MKLTGRRESTNVDDRRGMTAAKAGGVGIVGIIIALVMTFMSKGSLNLTDIISLAPSMMGNVTEQAEGGREFTEEEQALATFSKQILAGTEDVWAEEFKKLGRTYEPPKMVLYTGAVQTGCGNGSASMGPFYCSADQCLYIDLSFFTSMKQQLGADGDFAYAYVIAHEVGHHVEYLLGTLGKVHQQMSRLSEAEANKLSVRLELLADFYAGVWAYHDNKMFGSIEDGDLEEAIRCAQVIGDNYLQEKARGYSQPETFTHGTSKQRMKWLKLGLETGDIRRGTTFQCSDAEL
ncbi:MAG: neutral zinc metallopeptidase [Bacteroidaceae bacterium]|nr:neutral zinc metallopeptidase [Bacteroidaceae bacterium]MBQ9294750.1 neutral zinc metallopeptidase [Bacteroidaceae bacterium]MBQ9295111.1 neutral zinc metallopeptidase [Bacteroidaceae bacterium]